VYDAGFDGAKHRLKNGRLRSILQIGTAGDNGQVTVIQGFSPFRENKFYCPARFRWSRFDERDCLDLLTSVLGSIFHDHSAFIDQITIDATPANNTKIAKNEFKKSRLSKNNCTFGLLLNHWQRDRLPVKPIERRSRGMGLEFARVVKISRQNQSSKSPANVADGSSATDC
jgi:hypothetical protein